MSAWWLEKGTHREKENSHPAMNERNGKFRNHHTMAILGIPDVVVLEPVNINIQLVIGIEVHIGNKELYGEPSAPLSFEYSRDCILFGT
jgi:hypothetical protein